MSRAIWPQDPNEIFNATWLKFRERELKDKDWQPNNLEAYFVMMMKNLAIDWKKGHNSVSIDKVVLIDDEEPTEKERDEKLKDWIESPPKDHDEQFLKNVLTLAVMCNNINEACEVSGMSRYSFWKYRKKAINKFYESI